MSESDSVVVHILDKEYRVACPPGEKEALVRAARFLDEKMREVKDANVVGLERIAVMAALNLSHELLEARNDLDGQNRDSEALSSLVKRVEREIKAFESYREDLGGP